MKLKEALNLVTNLCNAYKGNLQDHQMIQDALQTIRDGLSKDNKEEPPKKNKRKS